MQLNIVFDVAGRLHPALVHLPIGILVLACCFELLSGAKKFATLKPAIPSMMLWGMLAALLSVLSGLALSSNGEYEDELVETHEWAGIAVAAVAMLLFLFYKKNAGGRVIKATTLMLLLLITITGHLGGSITHGEGYITAPLTGDDKVVEIKPIPDIQEAMLYTDVVQPLFQSRCYNCHDARKQKGKLRLDEQERILKGGESGNTVVPGRPDESELIERLLLPLDHDDHMPPKGKPQLTREQIDVLHWWVSTGPDFTKKVKELKQPETIKPVLLALQSGSGTSTKEVPDIPETPVAAADTAIIMNLTRAGVMVLPVARESNYLSANFVSANGNADSLLTQLLLLKNQLISLKMDGMTLQDSSVAKISRLTALRKLQLSNTNVTDQNIQHLSSLKALRSLNLVGTQITARGLIHLKELKELKNVYLYRTSVAAAEREELKKMFPEVNIDFGNYSLPMLKSDTAIIRY